MEDMQQWFGVMKRQRVGGDWTVLAYRFKDEVFRERVLVGLINSDEAYDTEFQRCLVEQVR